MALSQKCQYALRAVFELCRRSALHPTPIPAIAAAQAIPPRFLEAILNQLRQAGIVESRRGKDGGYLLARDPADLTMGEIIRLIEGPIEIVDCRSGQSGEDCVFHRDCVFWPVWSKAAEALAAVYDQASFAFLLEEDRKRAEHNCALHYSI